MTVTPYARKGILASRIETNSQVTYKSEERMPETLTSKEVGWMCVKGMEKGDTCNDTNIKIFLDECKIGSQSHQLSVFNFSSLLSSASCAYWCYPLQFRIGLHHWQGA